MPALKNRSLVLSVVLAVTTGVAAAVIVASTSEEELCPPGYKVVSAEELREEFSFGGETEAEREAAAEREAEEEEAEEEEGEGGEEEEQRYCLFSKHPEPFGELQELASEKASKAFAPFPYVRGGAYREALRQRAALIESGAPVPGSGGTWHQYGQGPLISNDPRYESVNSLGLVELNGRVDSLTYDPAHERLFSLIGTGGVWMSEDLGASWESIGDTLPSQINGAVDWSPAGGGDGTLIVVSGEHLMGGNTYTGIGAFWSNDLGETWHRADGVPDAAMGFQVAVDPTNPQEVYVATSKGLFRSTDTGQTFTNVNLPTDGCTGETGNGPCLLANFVTDVVVQSPDSFGNAGGEVVAAIGYRAGARPYPQDPGTLEGPYNGIYKSATGAPGTFAKLAATGFTPQNRIGRVELGTTDGPDQNHDYLYAIVQDAVRFNGGVPVIDVPEGTPAAPANTSFNGIYVSDDFGESWTQLADEVEISQNPATGSSLVVVGSSTFFAPGVQAWYNMWVKPDPTRHVGGVPTRLTFGLEEVWQNIATDVPLDGSVNTANDFHVIGQYFAGTTCLLLDTGVPVCPGPDPTTPETTTHPDQHDGIYIPDGQGGVTLIAGNDGGTYTQHVAVDEEFLNDGWGDGANNGYNTLLPYHAQMAKDGTVWFGLQDNGSGKIDPADGFRHFMTFGGDGFYVAVDPNNSDVAYSETTLADMRVTTDGGETWNCVDPELAGTKFSNPFVMDPTDANHLMTAGQQVVETLDGPDTFVSELPDGTCVTTWQEVFDLGDNAQTAEPNSMSAVDLQGPAAYVGFCGACDVINGLEFATGLATNVGGVDPPNPGTSDGWHFATAAGLPNRYITSMAIDPADSNTVYVTLGGYANRQWRPPGSFGDPNLNVGSGHVFKSTDAGETFTDISASLPDAPAFWVEKVGNQLAVGTQVGVFLSDDTSGSTWAALNGGLPVTPIASLQVAPQNSNLLVAATFGRGIYTYDLLAAPGVGAGPGPSPGPTIPKDCRRLNRLPAGTNLIIGTTGRDKLTGTPGPDGICGRKGKDTIRGLGENDLLIGGKGNDLLAGAGANDKLFAGAGNDRLLGGAGKDLLVGFGGKDLLAGGGGRNVLRGGGGQDECRGGAGGDKLRGCEV